MQGKQEKAAERKEKPQNEYFLNKQRQSEERKRRTKLRKTEEEIESLDAQMKEIQTHLGDESVTSDYEKLIELTNKLEELQAQQESLYEIWEELSE
ncbi:ABC transporter C-terminal domain-containing protein [uncultured Ruminococcus sp.]|uniref:ABC transporter C-terminal domain-containing protein n=1 Tax=uncultured Ruminococcus sp. TaxID=165186 RepID=UPI002931D11C|nr:ABC transporter C-terminal domain-containing protein [uncultured Ruminococcus sp.]